MDKKEKFMLEVKEILDVGIIENIKLKKVKIINKVLLDSIIIEIAYNNFEHNYDTCFDNDEMYYTKIKDFIYRLDLLINVIFNQKNNIKDTNLIYIIKECIRKNDIDLFSSVSYNNEDNEIIEDMNKEIIYYLTNSNSGVDLI